MVILHDAGAGGDADADNDHDIILVHYFGGGGGKFANLVLKPRERTAIINISYLLVMLNLQYLPDAVTHNPVFFTGVILSPRQVNFCSSEVTSQTSCFNRSWSCSLPIATQRPESIF